MSFENLDPLIRREFEALGMNIVGNDLLADIVIEKVRKRRIRKYLIIGAALLALALLAISSYVIFTSKGPVLSTSIVQSNSYADPGIAVDGKSKALALPQFARIEVRNNDAASRHVTFTFHLRPGQLLEIFTEPRLASGDVGLLKVYPHGFSDPASCLGTFQIGAGTGSNEFGNIAAEGLYDFVYDFTNINYYGQIRVGFLLGNMA
jgi:hypothetical protein